MTNAEKFAKLNGIEWHWWKKDENNYYYCTCSPKKRYNISDPRLGYNSNPVHNHPTFTDAKSILEVMMKREDWRMFCRTIGTVWHSEEDYEDDICIYYILNPDKLLKEAVKWCDEHRLKCQHEFNEETGYCIQCFDNVHSVRR